MRTIADKMRFAICVRNQGAEDLEVRKVYRVLSDRAAAAEGYLRVIDESGEDYLYPSNYFAFVALPRRVKRAWATGGRRTGRRASVNGREHQGTAATGRRRRVG